MDQQTTHFIAMDKNKIVAYGRMYVDCKTCFAVIQRICVHKDYRNQKTRYALMEKTMTYINASDNLKGSKLEANIIYSGFMKNLDFMEMVVRMMMVE